VKQIPGADRSGAIAVEWQLKLDCGHEVALPWGSASPAIAACILHHQNRCTADEPGPLAGLDWWVEPLAPPPVPAFR
jgi:hypothetical protein